MIQLRILPPDPAAGVGFPATGQLRIEGPEPFVMIWAVRFNYVNAVGIGGNRFYEVTFGNQSNDEQQRWWQHKLHAPAILDASGTCLFTVGAPESQTTALVEGVTVCPLVKMPMPSGAALFIAGVVDSADQISNIQIVAFNGTLVELMQM